MNEKLINAVSSDAVVDMSRGGPYFAEFIDQVRGLMDRVRLASPTDELALDVIAMVRAVNDRLDEAVVDEWSVPFWVRPDVPANGNITMPPFMVDRADREGVRARTTFRPFHLGANAAAHGGHIALAFDNMLGLASGRYVGLPIRTASLTVDYRSITPLDRELTLRAWVERQEGRKLYAVATLHDGDRLCAESHALFLVLEPGQQ